VAGGDGDDDDGGFGWAIEEATTVANKPN